MLFGDLWISSGPLLGSLGAHVGILGGHIPLFSGDGKRRDSLDVLSVQFFIYMGRGSGGGIKRR